MQNPDALLAKAWCSPLGAGQNARDFSWSPVLREAIEQFVVYAKAPSRCEGDGEATRVTLPELWPADSLVVMPSGSSVLPELVRTWDEAAHHIELAVGL